jgi:hypothetical protein
MVFLALGIWGCVQMSPEAQERINKLSAENERLVAEMEVIFGKAKDGSITALEAFVAANKIQKQLDQNRKEILAVKEQEDWGLKEAVLVGGTLLLRSGLHAARAFLPGWLGFLAPLLTGLLGGSEQKKRKKKAA